MLLYINIFQTNSNCKWAEGDKKKILKIFEKKASIKKEDVVIYMKKDKIMKRKMDQIYAVYPTSSRYNKVVNMINGMKRRLKHH